MMGTNIPLPPINKPSLPENRYDFFRGVFPIFTMIFMVMDALTVVSDLFTKQFLSEINFYQLLNVFWMGIALYYWGKRAYDVSTVHNLQKRQIEMETDLQILETIMTQIDPEILKEKGILLEKFKIPKKH